MKTITYLRLTENIFNEKSLDDFLRYQEVKECWRKNSNNEYVLVRNEYIEDWDLNKLREVALEIQNRIERNGLHMVHFMRIRLSDISWFQMNFLEVVNNMWSYLCIMYQNLIGIKELVKNFSKWHVLLPER